MMLTNNTRANNASNTRIYQMCTVDYMVIINMNFVGGDISMFKLQAAVQQVHVCDGTSEK